MARKKLITRRINFTKALVMCVDTNTGITFNVPYEIIGYKEEEAILEYVNNNTAQHVKAVTIIEVNYEKIQYGQTEEEFVKAGTKILNESERNN